MIVDKTIANIGKKCVKLSTRICDGYCNNCPLNLSKEDYEKWERNSSCASGGTTRMYHSPDYEGMILARQERNFE